MAVGTLTERAVSEAFAGPFVDDERALHVSATLGSTPNNTTYRLQKRFDFEGGTYTVKALADDAASWWVLTDEGGGKAIFGHVVTQGVAQGTIYIPPGRQRLEIILVNSPVVANPDFVGPISPNSDCFVAFSLWRNGQLVYASSAAGWVFDTVEINPTDVPSLGDPRRQLPLFRILPNWQAGVIERLSWRTEIFSDESDEEQTRSLRRFARRTFEATFTRYDDRRAHVESFLVGVGSNEILVPLWHDQQSLGGPLGIEYAFPPNTLRFREFHAGDLVLAMGRNPNDFEILEIASVTLGTDRIQFTDVPAKPWSIGSRITPLRVARVMDAPTMTSPTNRTGIVSVRFELSEPEKWPDPSWGYCVPLWRRRVDRAVPISKQFQRQTYIIDNQTGRVDVQDIGAQTRVGMRFGLKLFGRQDVFAFRQFIHMARGRAVRFWMPGLMSDLQLANNVEAGSYFDVKAAGIAEFLSTEQDARCMVAFVLKDGALIYRRVAGSIVVGEGLDMVERVFVERELQAIQVEAVAYVMFVLPARFDQDAFELQHLVDASAAVVTTVAVRSTDPAGLPEIQCDETTPPYPVVFEDAMDVGMLIVTGTLTTFGYPAEPLDVSMSIVSVTLNNSLNNYNPVPEGVDTTLSLVSGEFIQFLFSGYLPVPEEMATSMNIVSGTLILSIISTTMSPESMDVSAQITEGTLT